MKTDDDGNAFMVNEYRRLVITFITPVDDQIRVSKSCLPRASVFDPKSSPFSFKVQHECFGRCEGLVLPEAYTSPSAR